MDKLKFFYLKDGNKLSIQILSITVNPKECSRSGLNINYYLD